MDVTFLRRLGLALINSKRLLRDRKANVTPDEDGPLAVMGRVYAKAVASGQSLAEAASFSASTPDGITYKVWILDRNYDPLRCRERMVSTDQIKAMQAAIVNHGGPKAHHIVLSPNKLSPQAKKEALSANVLYFDDLLIDLPRHVLAVPHRAVSLDAARRVLGSSLKPSDLPLLPTSDPMARWYGFEPGTIVFLDNPTMPSFRVVVKA